MLDINPLGNWDGKHSLDDLKLVRMGDTPMVIRNWDERVFDELGRNREPRYLRHDDLLQDDTVLDIGAHVGIVTVWADNIAIDGEVHAFEPDPESCALLRINTAHSDTIHAHQLFVCGDSRGRAEMPFYKSSTLWRHSGYWLPGVRGREAPFNVETRPIGEILQETKARFVKLDAEGAEYEIILDGLLDFSEQVDVLTWEAHFAQKQWRETEYPRAMRELQAHGYHFVGRAPMTAGECGANICIHATKR